MTIYNEEDLKPDTMSMHKFGKLQSLYWFRQVLKISQEVKDILQVM